MQPLTDVLSPVTDAIQPQPQRRRRGRPPRQLRTILPHPTLSTLIEDPVTVRHSKPPGFLSSFIQAAPHNLGRLDHECEYCAALHWIEEATQDKQYEICCKKGDVDLPTLRMPPLYLRKLFTDQDPRGRAFRKEIREYNNALAFTSVSYTRDARIDENSGIQSFQIHGELFHYQSPLQPNTQETPAFAQLFFYDPSYATEARRLQHPHAYSTRNSIQRSLDSCYSYLRTIIRLSIYIKLLGSDLRLLRTIIACNGLYSTRRCVL
jgi:hypothetical protein